MSETINSIPVDSIRPSRVNPRGAIAAATVGELAESIRKHGILQPILVRPADGAKNGISHEVIAGHRRLAAAKAAGLTEIPARIIVASESQVLEIQLIENLQRNDLHPLEEAEGYRRLLTDQKYDVAKIAAKIGRSVAYIYDRSKLLELTPAIQEHFRADRITAGHAVLLARLKPADQGRALKGGLFEHEDLLWDEGEEKRGPGKVRSVRELRGWIDKNVRFDAKTPDPMLFPETVAALAGAPKVVAITFSHYLPPESRDGKTYFPQSWKRADGLDKSKTCGHSVTGFVAAGPHRGEAYPVCVAKDKCQVHWQAESRARRLKAGKDAPAKQASPGRVSPADAKLQAALEGARDRAYQAITAAVLAAAAKMPAGDLLRALAIVREWEIRDYFTYAKLSGDPKKWARQAPLPQVQQALAFSAMEGDMPEAFGIDQDAIYREHEKQARASKAMAPSPGTCRKCGCTEKKPCPGGCAWTDKSRTLCTSCDPSLNVPRVPAGVSPRRRKTTALKPRRSAAKKR